MLDTASPRDGWSHVDYSKHALTAKAGTFGAIFAMPRDLLLGFCERVQSSSISFKLFCVNALDISGYIGATNFDRIEVCGCSCLSSCENWPFLDL